MDLRNWSYEQAAGAALLLGFLSNFAGATMFWIRGGLRGADPPSRAYYVWERGLIMAAVVLTAIGFVVLEGRLASTGGAILARTGAAAYGFAGALLVVGETLGLGQEYKHGYRLMVLYVVTAFLAQAALGGALLQSGLLPAWIGWLSIVWNLGWLVVLPIVSRRDLYYPVLHHFIPLVAGIALLLGAR